MSADASDNVAELMTAFIKAKQAFGTVLKDKTNPAFRSKYADLGAVLDAVEPALLANGLALVGQSSVRDDGEHVLFTRLIHTSGQWLGSTWAIRPIKNDPQGFGSALTYARRYQAQTLLGLAPEDDDGQAAAAGPKARQPRRETPPSADAPPASEPITRAQQTRLHAALGDLNLTSRDDKLAFCSEYIDRQITSSSDLTKAEAGRLITYIAELIAARGRP